jgi:hypothetical protein
MYRRSFVTVASAGAASVVGTSILTRRGWARPPATAMNNAGPISTREHFGDMEEHLVFPGDWQIEIQHMKGHGRPAMTEVQIREKLRQPIDFT